MATYTITHSTPALPGYAYYIDIYNPYHLPSVVQLYVQRQNPSYNVIIFHIEFHTRDTRAIRYFLILFANLQWSSSADGMQNHIRTFLSYLAVPPCIVELLAPEVASSALELASQHDFATNRMLPIFLHVYVGDENINDDDILEIIMWESQLDLTVPATTSSIEALEEVDYSKEIEGKTDCCVVCLEKLSYGNKEGVVLSRMPCSHVFHKECIVKWLETSHLCPLCRYAMPTY